METSHEISNLSIHDHTAQWLELSDQVRFSLQETLSAAAGTAVEPKLRQLATDVTKICDHVERIHHDAKRMLSELGGDLPKIDHIPAGLDPDEVQREAIQIQRETHELRRDFKDIIKALFMWHDTPEDRVREKH